MRGLSEWGEEVERLRRWGVRDVGGCGHSGVRATLHQKLLAWYPALRSLRD